MNERVQNELTETTRPSRLSACAEVSLIFVVFLIFAGWPPPDVNEAHYLAKAKHFWNPDWCAGDHFLESADAHEVFYWTFGWLTLLFPLPVVAWIGRVLTWGLIAWAWRRLSFAVVPRPMVAVLSAGLFLLFLQRCEMAGEWVIGGVEAKGFAFVFVLLGMEAVARGRWRAVWLLLGAASAFHVLVGGWAVVAAMFAWLLMGRKQTGPLAILPFLIAGFLLSLPGLLPAVALTWNEDPEIVRRANSIYVYHRLSHHLEFLELFRTVEGRRHIIRHVSLALAWLVVAIVLRGNERCKRINALVGGAVLIAVTGVLIDYATLGNNDLGAKLLRLYWFRLSDAVLPMGMALGLVALMEFARGWRPLAAHGLAIAGVLAMGINLGLIVYERYQDFRPRADAQTLNAIPDNPEWTQQHFANWLAVCAWIEANTDEDARFLTPPRQQTFKWYAQRSEVANWKDIPQDATGIVEWWKRMQDIYPGSVRTKFGLAKRGDGKLAQLARKYDADYILVDRSFWWRVRALPKVYPPPGVENSSYEIYRVPPPPPPLPELTPTENGPDATVD